LTESLPDSGKVVDGAGAVIAGGGIGGARLILRRVSDRPVLGLALICVTASEPCPSTASPL
jgi:hypothetical protein